ncbi:glycosyltransferase [Halomonas sp. DN3]|nr:glycosyltransferase [Halomonas sp. DN3]
MVRAVGTVLSQGYQEIECIVVDDASTDDTVEVLRALANDDQRLKVVQLERNAGQSAARNTGARLAKGHWICFLDSDDELLPGAIASRVAVYQEDPEFEGIAFGGNIVAGKQEVAFPGPIAKGGAITISDYLKGHGWLHTNAFMLPRELFWELEGFREDLRQKEDVEFFIRVLCRVNARYSGQACSRMYDLGGMRARNHHERIVQQEYRFVDAVCSNPEVVQQVEPRLLDLLVKRGVSTYLNALYRTSRYSEFRKAVRRGARKGEVELTSRWVKRYVLSYIRAFSN